MTVIPDTPFDEDGWGDSVSTIITLCKRVRALELQVAGFSNDLNQNSTAFDQESEGSNWLSAINIQGVINQSLTNNPLVTMRGFSGINAGPQTVNSGALDVLAVSTVLWDSHGAWNAAANVYTFPTTGLWVLLASCASEGISAGLLANRLIVRTTVRDFGIDGELTTGAVPATLRMPTTVAVVGRATAGDRLSLHLDNTGVSNSQVFDISLSAFTIGS